MHAGFGVLAVIALLSFGVFVLPTLALYAWYAAILWGWL